jgi:hypothetical protein
MGEEQLIEAVARLWVENGGDAEGIDWCVSKIKSKIEELKTEDDQ